MDEVKEVQDEVDVQVRSPTSWTLEFGELLSGGSGSNSGTVSESPMGPLCGGSEIGTSSTRTAPASPGLSLFNRTSLENICRTSPPVSRPQSRPGSSHGRHHLYPRSTSKRSKDEEISSNNDDEKARRGGQNNLIGDSLESFSSFGQVERVSSSSSSSSSSPSPSKEIRYYLAGAHERSHSQISAEMEGAVLISSVGTAMKFHEIYIVLPDDCGEGAIATWAERRAIGFKDRVVKISAWKACLGLTMEVSKMHMYAPPSYGTYPPQSPSYPPQPSYPYPPSTGIAPSYPPAGPYGYPPAGGHPPAGYPPTGAYPSKPSGDDISKLFS